jgi:hypothetical protein
MATNIGLKKGDILYHIPFSIEDIKSALPDNKQAEFLQKIKNNSRRFTVGKIFDSLQIDIDTVTESLAQKLIEEVEVKEIFSMKGIAGSECALLSNGQRINPNDSPIYKKTEEEAINDLKEKISNIIYEES